MMPGNAPGSSGQTAKLGIGPYLVVTTTSFSIMGVGLLREGGTKRAARALRDHPGLSSRDVRAQAGRTPILCDAVGSGITPGRAAATTHRSLRRRLPTARLR